MKYTKTPWRYEVATKTIRAVPSNYWLATMDSWDGAVNHQANAEFIVRACNSHEELVEAAELVDRAWAGDGVDMSVAVDAILLAIANAEGGRK